MSNMVLKSTSFWIQKARICSFSHQHDRVGTNTGTSTLAGREIHCGGTREETEALLEKLGIAPTRIYYFGGFKVPEETAIGILCGDHVVIEKAEKERRGGKDPTHFKDLGIDVRKFQPFSILVRVDADGEWPDGGPDHYGDIQKLDVDAIVKVGRGVRIALRSHDVPLAHVPYGMGTGDWEVLNPGLLAWLRQAAPEEVGSIPPSADAGTGYLRPGMKLLGATRTPWGGWPRLVVQDNEKPIILGPRHFNGKYVVCPQTPQEEGTLWNINKKGLIQVVGGVWQLVCPPLEEGDELSRAHAPEPLRVFENVQDPPIRLHDRWIVARIGSRLRYFELKNPACQEALDRIASSA